MRIANEVQALFGEGQLQTLLLHEDHPCVSLYLPSRRMGAESKTIPFRLGQLLDQVETQLVGKGYRLPDAQAILKPARDLPGGARAPFWQHQQEGLALFISPSLFLHFQLPLAFTEQVTTGNRFTVRPLLPLLSGDGTFYVLALSEKQVRFYQGTRYAIHEIPLHNAPHNLAETLRYDQFEKQLQHHATAGGAGRGGASIFHGQGDAGDAALNRKHLARYVHEIDEEVSQLLSQRPGQNTGETHAPLILAGVDTLQGLYRSTSRYPAVIKSGLDGNPDHISAQELHSRAWALIATQYQAPKTLALEKFRAHYAGGNHPNHVPGWRSIVQAAYFQQVDTLFIAEGAHLTGIFDTDTAAVSVHEMPQEDDQDLVDLTAAYTLRNGGTVYMLAADEMPFGLPIAAILRV